MIAQKFGAFLGWVFARLGIACGFLAALFRHGYDPSFEYTRKRLEMELVG